VHGKKGAAADKEKGKPAEEAGAAAGKIVLDQKEVDDALQNLDKLTQEVRIVPNFQDGKPAGMKVLSIKPGGLASKLGIRRGDVLEKVNGQELDIKRGMELFSTMRDSKNFSLDVTRGGKNQTLEYEIK
jgi:general secretion pathway protein C